MNKIVYRDGHLISVSDDKTALVYDLQSGKVVAEFRLPNFIRALALHPSGRWALLGSYQEAVVWDYTADRVVAHAKVEGWVSGIACPPNTDEALLVTWEGEILVWDIRSGRVSPVPKPNLGEVKAVSPDCSRLIGVDGTHLRLYSLPELKLEGEISLEKEVKDVAWILGQDAFVTLSGNGLKLWDAQTLKCRSKLPEARAGYRLSVSRDGKFVAVQGDDRAWLCDMGSLVCDEVPLPEKARCEGVAVSPGGRRVAVLFAPGGNGEKEKLLIWNTASGKVSMHPAAGFEDVFFWDENIVLVKPGVLRILKANGSIHDIDAPTGWRPVCRLRSDGVLACGKWGEITVIDLNHPTSPYRIKLCKAYRAVVRSIFLCDRFVIVATGVGTTIVHELPEGDRP